MIKIMIHAGISEEHQFQLKYKALLLVNKIHT